MADSYSAQICQNQPCSLTNLVHLRVVYLSLTMEYAKFRIDTVGVYFNSILFYLYSRKLQQN